MPETTLFSQLVKINSKPFPNWRKDEYRDLIFRKFGKKSRLVQEVIGGKTTFEQYVGRFSPSSRPSLPIRARPDADKSLDELGVENVLGSKAVDLLRTSDGGFLRFARSKLFNPLAVGLISGLALTGAIAVNHYSEMSLDHYIGAFLHGVNTGLVFGLPLYTFRLRNYVPLKHQAKFLDDNLEDWKQYDDYQKTAR